MKWFIEKIANQIEQQRKGNFIVWMTIFYHYLNGNDFKNDKFTKVYINYALYLNIENKKNPRLS